MNVTILQYNCVFGGVVGAGHGRVGSGKPIGNIRDGMFVLLWCLVVAGGGARWVSRCGGQGPDWPPGLCDPQGGLRRHINSRDIFWLDRVAFRGFEHAGKSIGRYA